MRYGGLRLNAGARRMRVKTEFVSQSRFSQGFSQVLLKSELGQQAGH